jgi:hypothetical protein
VVVSNLVEVTQEAEDALEGQVGKGEPGDLAARVPGDEPQEQLDGVAIAAD